MSTKQLASLGFALALVYSISLPARADLLKNLKTDGSIESRSYSIDNLTDRNGTADDYTAQTNVRIMVGATTDLLDDVHARILLDNAPGSGKAGSTGAKSVFGTGPGTVQGVQNDFAFDNAYVKIDKVFGHVDLTMGQQFYNDPSDLVVYFGPQNDDVLSVTSLSAFRADSDIMGVAHFKGIAGKTSENTVVGSNSDTDLWGGELSTDKIIPAGNLAAYYYSDQVKKAANVVAGNNTLNVFGLRANGDIKVVGGLGYMAEFIQDGGRNNGVASQPGYGGSAYDLGLRYGQDFSGMPFRAKAEYARGSDNFTAIAPGRRFGIIWGEHTSVAADPSNLNRTNGVGQGNAGSGLSNLKIATLGVGINPISKLGVDLNWYRFQYDANLNATGTSAGTEYDLIVSWRHSENVYLEANAASFQVGQALQNGGVTPTSPITRLGEDIRITF